MGAVIVPAIARDTEGVIWPLVFHGKMPVSLGLLPLLLASLSLHYTCASPSPAPIFFDPLQNGHEHFSALIDATVDHMLYPSTAMSSERSPIGPREAEQCVWDPQANNWNCDKYDPSAFFHLP